ncbi:unnamed protein product [Rhizopus stolonifer]
MSSPYRNLRAIQSSHSSVPSSSLEDDEIVEITDSSSMDYFSGHFWDVDVEMDSVSPAFNIIITRPCNPGSRVYQFHRIEEMGPIKTAALKIFSKAEEFGVPRQFQ